MSKKKVPQPAKKSYFFGSGFKDIGTAIRESWAKNAGTARTYYRNYQKSGMLSFQGIYNLFCAISVAVFGTVFFAAISAVMLAVVSVLFVVVYAAFCLVWLFDRLYLVRNKIFVTCPICHTKSSIPVYICPGCGAKHTDLTPGKYGIFKRTCLCGEKLPTTFFSGRRKLRAICPECDRRGRRTRMNDRESRPLCVPVVGGRSVGKTAYITAFSKLFVDTVAPKNGIDVEIYSEEKKLIYMDIKDDFAAGSTRMTARSQDVNTPSAVAFSFFVKHPKLKPERLLHIYDIAGEVFTQNQENEVQKQYDYCHGIIFMVDPFGIPTVRARYGNLLPMKDRAGIGIADLNGIIDAFINKIREVTGLTDKQMSNVPLAVVIGKIDSPGLRDEFSNAQIEAMRKAQPGLDYADAMDLLCRDFLSRNDMRSFVNAINMKFRVSRYFAVSAIGHTRDEGSYHPRGVLEPMEWICQRADKELYDLWGEHKFNKTPAAPMGK